MTDKVVGKPGSKSRTLWFSGALVTSGATLAIVFLTSPAFDAFMQANVPNFLYPVAVAAIGAIQYWLRKGTTEPIAK